MLAFRFGFLCHHAQDAPAAAWRRKAAKAGWPSQDFGEFRIWLHTEARLEVHARAEGVVVVLGDAVSQSGRALADLCAGVPWDDPWPALDDLCGRFAILLLSGSRMRAAHDAFGARSLFYSPGRNAVSSHATLLARAYGLPASDAVARFMELPEYRARTVSYLPGDITAHEGVHALVPNNFWDDGATRRYWPRAPRRETGREAFLAETRRYFDAFVPFVRERYAPVFGVTGGIDSRAAFAPFGSGFEGVTWTHYFPETERPIVEAIVAHLRISHRFVSSGRGKRSAITRAGGVGAGGLRPGHRLTGALAAAYPAGHVFIRGYGGEILRGFPPYRERIFDLTAESMTAAYGSSIRRQRHGPAHRAFCDEMFAEFRVRANYDGLEAFGFKAMDHFYWEHRMGMWGAAMLNEMDPGLYSMVGFNSRPLFEAAFGLDDDERLTKELLAAVVGLYDPALAAIPMSGSPASFVQRCGSPPARRRSVSASSTPQSLKRIRTAVRRWLKG